VLAWVAETASEWCGLVPLVRPEAVLILVLELSWWRVDFLAYREETPSSDCTFFL
jgi:hypothetical protein